MHFKKSVLKNHLLYSISNYSEPALRKDEIRMT